MEATYDKKLCLMRGTEHSDEEYDLQEENGPSAAFLHFWGDIHQIKRVIVFPFLHRKKSVPV